MKCAIFLVIVGFAATLAMPFDLIEDTNGEEYLAIPLSRVRREEEKPRGSIGADVNRNPDGTAVRVDGKYNVYQTKNTEVGVHGQYERRYGGPYGTGRPNYGVGIGFQHRF